MVAADTRDWEPFPQEAVFVPRMKQMERSPKAVMTMQALDKAPYNSRRPPTPPSISSRPNAFTFSSPKDVRDPPPSSPSSARSPSGSFRFNRSAAMGERQTTKPLSLSEPDRTYSSTSSSSASDIYENPAAAVNDRPKVSSTSGSRERGRSRDTSQQPKVPSQVARSLSRTRSVTSAPSSRGRSSVNQKETTRETQKRSTSSNSKKTTNDQRGRSQSRSRPPSTRQNNTKTNTNTSTSRASSLNSRRSRSRSRSKSLTRVTGPSPLLTPRGHSPRPVNRKPPSTLRTRQELKQKKADSNSSLGSRGGSGSRRSYTISDDGSYNSTGQANNGTQIGQDIVTFGVSTSTTKKSETRSTASKGGFMEKLFGDHVVKIPRSPTTNFQYEVRPRILLAATVYHNTKSNLWVATINTHQRGVARDPAKANRHLKAFSFASEREARESAIANAPPKMIPIADAPFCFMCKGKFAMFRRASHCRNCGVCVCPNCTTTWVSKCLPDTYNLKKDASVKVCLACNSLSTSFKNALLDGDYEEAVALYGTGNVNLRTPFPISGKKDEVMYPIHCAAEGGNLNVLRWLLEDHQCPYKIVPPSKTRKSRHGDNDVPILTSKGRSMLSIAVDSVKVDVMQYLVVECGIAVHECSDLKNVLRALEVTLLSLPPPRQSGRMRLEDLPDCTRWDKASFDEVSEPSTLGDEEPGCIDAVPTSAAVESNPGSLHPTKCSEKNDAELCLICFEQPVDSCAAACGHRTCCLECSTNLVACPVCNTRSGFVKIYHS